MRFGIHEIDGKEGDKNTSSSLFCLFSVFLKDFYDYVALFSTLVFRTNSCLEIVI